MLYSAVQCSAEQCSAAQCSAVQYSAVQWNTVQNIYFSTYRATNLDLSSTFQRIGQGRFFHRFAMSVCPLFHVIFLSLSSSLRALDQIPASHWLPSPPQPLLNLFIYIFIYIYIYKYIYFFLITQPLSIFFIDKSRNLSEIVSVLLSASLERFFVSPMRDFYPSFS